MGEGLGGVEDRRDGTGRPWFGQGYLGMGKQGQIVGQHMRKNEKGKKDSGKDGYSAHVQKEQTRMTVKLEAVRSYRFVF